MKTEAATISADAGAIWTHAHSFRLGWLLFARKDRASVAQLYAALRFVDDFVDEASASQRPQRFARVAIWARAAREGRSGDLPSLVASLIAQKTSPENWAEFFAGQQMDAQARPCVDAATRELYCQRVAGVVGLMFCDLLGITDVEAREKAAALGRAMQLTNMARDVVEDAGRGRSYLTSAGPKVVLQAVEPQQRAEIEAEVLAWLKQADVSYESGLSGLRFLPLRAALGVAVGARLYRAIGDKISHDPGLIWRGRVRTSRFEKLFLGIHAVCGHLGERLGRCLR